MINPQAMLDELTVEKGYLPNELRMIEASELKEILELCVLRGRVIARMAINIASLRKLILPNRPYFSPKQIIKKYIKEVKNSEV